MFEQEAPLLLTQRPISRREHGSSHTHTQTLLCVPCTEKVRECQKRLAGGSRAGSECPLQECALAGEGVGGGVVVCSRWHPQAWAQPLPVGSACHQHHMTQLGQKNMWPQSEICNSSASCQPSRDLQPKQQRATAELHIFWPCEDISTSVSPSVILTQSKCPLKPQALNPQRLDWPASLIFKGLGLLRGI